MPMIMSEVHPINQSQTITWDWDGTDSDLRAFLREIESAGGRVSLAVAVERGNEKYWFGGAVRATRGLDRAIPAMRRHLLGLQEQSAGYIAQESYLGSADAFSFDGTGLSAQAW